MSTTTEPVITINGTQLTEAQAMAVRVAVTTFRSEMAAPGALGDDQVGAAIAQGYNDRLGEVLKLVATPR